MRVPEWLQVLHAWKLLSFLKDSLQRAQKPEVSQIISIFVSTDPLRQDNHWEELFMRGDQRDSASIPPSSPSSGGVAAEKMITGIDMVSFDLDDTLWCGKTVIKNANEYVT